MRLKSPQECHAGARESPESGPDGGDAFLRTETYKWLDYLTEETVTGHIMTDCLAMGLHLNLT